MVQKKTRLAKCLYHHSEWNLTASNGCVVKMTWISTSVLYYALSKLYILTELSANDIKFISVDRQKVDLSQYIIIITYDTVNSIFVEIQPDSTNIKNDPRINQDIKRTLNKDKESILHTPEYRSKRNLTVTSWWARQQTQYQAQTIASIDKYLSRDSQSPRSHPPACSKRGKQSCQP